MTLKGQTRDPNTLRAQYRKLLELETSNLVCSFVLGMPSRRTNNFPESGQAWPRSRDPYNFWQQKCGRFVSLEPYLFGDCLSMEKDSCLAFSNFVEQQSCATKLLNFAACLTWALGLVHKDLRNNLEGKYIILMYPVR